MGSKKLTNGIKKDRFGVGKTDMSILVISQKTTPNLSKRRTSTRSHGFRE